MHMRSNAVYFTLLHNYEQFFIFIFPSSSSSSSHILFHENQKCIHSFIYCAHRNNNSTNAAVFFFRNIYICTYMRVRLLEIHEQQLALKHLKVRPCIHSIPPSSHAELAIKWLVCVYLNYFIKSCIISS